MSHTLFLRTRIPGPKSRALLRRRRNVVSAGIAATTPIFVRRARGAMLEDVDGNRLIDFGVGISSTNVGHAEPHVTRAIAKAVKDFTHVCFFETGYEPFVRLCEVLHQITPGRFQKKTALFTTGAEAVENAVKIARRATGRPAIVSFTHAFHGRTLLTLSLTSRIDPYKYGFGPFAPEVYHLEYPYPYRRPAACQTVDAYVDYLLGKIEGDFFHGVIDPKHIAAVIMEPVTGEGGFIVPPKRYVQELVKLCRKHGIVFIADEIQTGFGRTGRMFASEHFGIEPDLLCMAKSLGSGMPLSAVTGRAALLDAVQPGGLGGTFGGHAASCAAALATIDVLQKQKLIARAAKIGTIIMKRFSELAERSPIVGEARGLGAMCALEIVRDKRSRQPDPARAKKIADTIVSRGVIVLSCGLLGNDVRALPPLVITDIQLHEALDVISDTVLKFS